MFFGSLNIRRSIDDLIGRYFKNGKCLYDYDHYDDIAEIILMNFNLCGSLSRIDFEYMLNLIPCKFIDCLCSSNKMIIEINNLYNGTSKYSDIPNDMHNRINNMVKAYFKNDECLYEEEYHDNIIDDILHEINLCDMTQDDIKYLISVIPSKFMCKLQSLFKIMSGFKKIDLNVNYSDDIVNGVSWEEIQTIKLNNYNRINKLSNYVNDCIPEDIISSSLSDKSSVEWNGLKYFITITTKLIGRDALKNVTDIMNAILQSKMIDVQKYIYCWELTKRGNPHIHLVIFSGKCRPSDVRFNKIRVNGEFICEPSVKIELISDNKANHHINDFVGYVTKSSHDQQIIKYCEKNNINQLEMNGVKLMENNLLLVS